MHLSDILFTGFNKRVAALHRDTGEILWQWKAPFGMSYVSLLLDGDRLIVSVDGYMYALDPFTGAQLWMNEMKGLGTGVTSLASARGSSSAHIQAAATSTTASAAAASSTTTTAAT